jgi:hypothetical protein
MSAAFAGWFSPITLTVITQTINAGLVTDTESTVTFQGVIQPLSPEQIQLKPEAQRSFQWLQIHCKTGGGTLNTNDRIIYGAKTFKVMAPLDYSLNGFLEYHAIEDYEAV